MGFDDVDVQGAAETVPGRLAASRSRTPAVRGPPPMKAMAGTRDGMGSPEKQWLVMPNLGTNRAMPVEAAVTAVHHTSRSVNARKDPDAYGAS